MTVEEIQKFMKTLRTFNAMDPKMQVSTVLTLCEIAMADMTKQEMVVQDIQKKVGVSSGAATRNVYYWEEGYGKDDTGGHNYVMLKVSTKDRRLRTCHLTNSGKAFINNLGE